MALRYRLWFDTEPISQTLESGHPNDKISGMYLLSVFSLSVQ